MQNDITHHSPSFSDDSLEQFLKNSARDFLMRPAPKVWKGIAEVTVPGAEQEKQGLLQPDTEPMLHSSH